jgi:GNAT superfamily N-acetyltransferase
MGHDEPAMIELRALREDDQARYNVFLSRGVELHPDTLRIAGDDIARSPFSTAPTADALTFAAVELDADGAERWLGVGSIERETTRLKRRHIAWVMRMFVSEPGRGVGRTLLRELVGRAAAMPGVTKVNLTVAAHNAAAVHLYSSEGFREYSREGDAFRAGERSVVELSMSCELTGYA